MSVMTLHVPTRQNLSKTAERARSDPGYGAFLLLRVGFTALPIVFGVDKFTNILVQWDHYLAPWIVRVVPTTAHQTMLIVGVIEIIAGLAVAIKPRYGALLVSAWLAGIVINLFSYPGFYDIALRDFGLLLAALTLARLASAYDSPWRRRQPVGKGS
jgi:uncharacterized membrane protein YphA (DoxX/SURF4 family)